MTIGAGAVRLMKRKTRLRRGPGSAVDLVGIRSKNPVIRKVNLSDPTELGVGAVADAAEGAEKIDAAAALEIVVGRSALTRGVIRAASPTKFARPRKWE